MISFDFWKVYEFRKSRLVYYIWLLSLFNSFICLFIKRSKNLKDYFVASREQKSKKLAISILATQCSTNSILGAPAFVAFSVGGGLGWLKYELAVPLSMIAIMIFIYPIFYKLKSNFNIRVPRKKV